MAALVDARLFARIRQMRERFDALSGRIAEAYADVPAAQIDDRSGRAIENTGKERCHGDHQEHGEGNAHQERRELRLVVDQQLVGEFEDSRHGRLPSDALRLERSLYEPDL